MKKYLGEIKSLSVIYLERKVLRFFGEIYIIVSFKWLIYLIDHQNKDTLKESVTVLHEFLYEKGLIQIIICSK